MGMWTGVGVGTGPEPRTQPEFPSRCPSTSHAAPSLSRASPERALQVGGESGAIVECAVTEFADGSIWVLLETRGENREVAGLGWLYGTERRCRGTSEWGIKLALSGVYAHVWAGWRCRCTVGLV